MKSIPANIGHVFITWHNVKWTTQTLKLFLPNHQTISVL